MFDIIAPTLVPEASGKAHDLGGLLGIGDERRAREVAFPLREVRVRSSVAANCCRTIVEQVFDNPYEQALEAVHIFPLPPDAAVTEFELRAGDAVVRGECRERQAAEQAFEQARKAGRRAGLLTAERADVHTIRVTNIPPGTAVTVRLVLVQRLEEADGAFTWRFPTVIAPRYVPGSALGHQGPGTVPDTDAVPDASRLQPPVRLAGGARLDLEVEIAGPLAALESSLHAIRTRLAASATEQPGDGSRADVVRVAPSGRATLDRDFVLRFAPAAAEAASVRAYTDGQFTLAVVSPPAAVDTPRVPRDVVVLSDVSGSMAGEKLEAAKRALSAVVHGLEKGDRFRLIAFESSVHPHTRALVPFDQASLEQADRWIHQLQPMGGTEMLPALREAFAGTTPVDRLRTVIFITDGQASDEERLVGFIDAHRGEGVLFTVGIDTAVNESLLRRLANIGHGTCELLTPQDDIEDAIARIEARFGAPVATGLSPVALEAARPQPLHIFAGRPVTMLLRGTVAELRFKGTDASGRPIELAAAPAATVSFPLGALWARERVGWLEDRIATDPSQAKKAEQEIVAIALQHHIASRFTAFVAIEERVSNEGERVTVVQPAELPALWDESFRMAAQRAVAPMTSAASVIAARGPSLEDMEADEAMGSATPEVQMYAELPPPLRLSVARRAMGPTGREAIRDIETWLATSQEADGSFGGSIGRTAAALVTLLRLGHTRQAGTRRRVVQKCARWLMQHAGEGTARLALDLLFRLESGGERPHRDEVEDLLKEEPESRGLMRAFELT